MTKISQTSLNTKPVFTGRSPFTAEVHQLPSDILHCHCSNPGNKGLWPAWFSWCPQSQDLHEDQPWNKRLPIDRVVGLLQRVLQRQTKPDASHTHPVIRDDRMLLSPLCANIDKYLTRQPKITGCKRKLNYLRLHFVNRIWGFGFDLKTLSLTGF